MPDHLPNSETETVLIPEAEAIQIEELHRLLKKGKATLTSADGLHQLKLPDPLYRLLLRMISDVLDGRPISYTPATKDLTTQQAANLLGTSRQFLVGLLDKGEMPYHRVGTHRRIKRKDVMEYRRQRDRQRHEALNQMAKDAVESGYYDEF